MAWRLPRQQRPARDNLDAEMILVEIVVARMNDE